MVNVGESSRSYVCFTVNEEFARSVSGSTDYVHSSLTEGTSINVAQEYAAICLRCETPTVAAVSHELREVLHWWTL
ncbi:hypothetical protein HZH68_016514 [Vespula germanica]|uniref:Uncharacterized protein n=2 Tax=Vespula TaxID=7451 RepID=A0A834J2L2_VESGE|nr:hypothetical protein HZH66_014882 [Vespula vulgaris]KAF7380649.1 hypothetical protein HZH68_016514 [Vespula germanica]